MSLGLSKADGEVSTNAAWVRPVIALIGIVSSAAYGFVVDWDATVPAMTAFFITMAVASAIDLAERRVPNRLVLVATPLVAGLLVLAAVQDAPGSLASALVGGVLLFGVFFLIHLGSPSSFGAGDVKISFVIGLSISWFGTGQIVWFLVWMWLGLAAVGIPILRREGRGAKPSIPFVPILSFASVVTILIAAS